MAPLPPEPGTGGLITNINPQLPTNSELISIHISEGLHSNQVGEILGKIYVGGDYHNIISSQTGVSPKVVVEGKEDIHISLTSETPQEVSISNNNALDIVYIEFHQP